MHKGENFAPYCLKSGKKNPCWLFYNTWFLGNWNSTVWDAALWPQSGIDIASQVSVLEDWTSFHDFPPLVYGLKFVKLFTLEIRIAAVLCAEQRVQGKEPASWG